LDCSLTIDLEQVDQRRAQSADHNVLRRADRVLCVSPSPRTLHYPALTLTLPAAKLIQAHRALPADIQHAATKASSTLRLQVSGSAPLPVSVKAAWERDGGVGGGQVLLERYGMTETGLIATNGWADEKRVAVSEPEGTE
jgi:acyl-CoA synthetase (AMP-forming)/AMP-acid ligase II